MSVPFTLKLRLLFVLPFFAALSSQGQTIIAQQTDISAGWSGFSNYYDAMDDYTYYQGVGQTFKSLVTGTLGTIQFYAIATGAAGTTNIEIYSCSSTTTWGSLLGTKTGVSITAANGWKTADVTALNIHVTAGNYYGIRMKPQSGLMTNIAESGNAYPDGTAWSIQQNGSVNIDNGYNLAFKATAASSLPIALNAFTAQKQAGNVLLQWSTATEQNSRDFTLQHSVNGNTWSNIATLPAAGASNTLRYYSYVHASPAAGNNYYRLLQADMDGKSNYTDIRTVNFAGGKPGFTVLTNPVSNGVLKLQVNNATDLSMYSPDGRLLWKKQVSEGAQTIDMSAHGKGVFLLKGNSLSEKILVL